MQSVCIQPAGPKKGQGKGWLGFSRMGGNQAKNGEKRQAQRLLCEKAKGPI